MQSAGEWRFLRRKADETTDDPNWARVNTATASITEPTGGAAILAQMPDAAGRDGPVWTGIEVVVKPVTAARVPIDHSAVVATVDLALVEVFERDISQFGGTVGLADFVRTTGAETVELSATAYFPVNGSHNFTIRITTDVNVSGLASIDALEVWWRAVAR